MRRKICSVVLVTAMLVSMLTGCGSKGEDAVENSAQSEEEKVTLSFYVWNSEEVYIQKVIDEYEKSHENVSIELTVVSGENTDYEEKLQMLFSAKDDSVDLVDLRGTAQLSELANGGALQDITDMLSNNPLDISSYGPMWDSSAVGGRFYALPTRATCWVLYYNKDILDKAGIAYPSEQLTWKEYADLCDVIYQTCKEKGITAADGSEVKGGMLVNWVMDYYSIQKGVYLNSDDTDSIRECLETSKDIYDRESCYSYTQINATDFDYLADFENGKAALMPNGEWMVNMFMEDIAAGKADVNWGVTYMPIPEGAEDYTTFGDFQYVGISAYSKHKEESFDFLTYLAGESGAEIYSRDGVIHAYSSDDVIAAYKETTNNDTVSVFFESKKIQESPVDEGYAEIKQAFMENADLYLLNETSLDECMEKFINQRNSILNK